MVILNAEVDLWVLVCGVLRPSTERGKLFAGFFWDVIERPNLTVRVRIRAAHSRALVLEDLDVLDKGVLSRDLLVDPLPALDDGDDVLIR